MKAMDILAGDHRQRFFGFRSFSLDVYYIDSSPREPRFVLVPLRFASKAWPRAGLGEPRSASNANKPASSWPLKQGRKKCSKHGCDRGTSTVHEHKQSERHLYKDPGGPSKPANQNKPKKHKTNNHDDPQIPQPDLRFVKRKQQTRQKNKTTHRLRSGQ